MATPNSSLANFEMELAGLIMRFDDVSLQDIRKVQKKVLTMVRPSQGLNSYQQFVKDNIPVVKQEHPHMSGRERMAEVARMWRELKEKPMDGNKRKRT